MIKSIYIAKEVEYLKYLIRKDYSDCKIVDCSSLSFEEFLSLHNPSLFSNRNTVKCFVGVDKFKQDQLLPVVDCLSCAAVWGFSSLPKNYKLYKKLSKQVEITHGGDLTKESIKNSLIKELLKKYALPAKYLSVIKKNVPSNPAIIEQEVRKFAHALSVLKDEAEAEETLCIYNTNKDVLNLISNLLNEDVFEFYRHSLKVSNEVPLLIVHATVLKKLKALTFLSLGCTDEANKAWRASGYFLQNDIKLAKRLGFKYLIELYLKTDEILGNIYSEKDSFTRLCELGFYHYRSTRAL